MPFDWLETPTSAQRTQRDRASLMYRSETRRQAEMLKRFGFSRDLTLKSCVDTHRWEYTDFGSPALSDQEISAIVDRVYKV